MINQENKQKANNNIIGPNPTSIISDQNTVTKIKDSKWIFLTGRVCPIFMKLTSITVI